MNRTLCTAVLAIASSARAQDIDTDGDGLSDFQEVHKYFTDPAKADTDGDGIPDGDWNERREYAYTIRTVLRVMPPCVAISDQFGAHCTLENPEVADGEFHALTISRVVWYSDQKRANPVQMRLDDPDTAGHLVMHVEEGRMGEGPSQFIGFYGRVGKEFVLKAAGHPDVRAHATRGYWVKVEEDMKEFYLRIEPDEFARMAPGVAYELAVLDSGAADRWVVKAGVTIARAK